ncbi:MAG: hypothetical protein OEZ22_02880 [Spirochaetia bacterium]|nr:hypothetical protein [Spirochaetia bacterium]
MKIKIIKKLKGITLIEIMVALLFFAGVFTFIQYFLIGGIQARKEAGDLQKAVFLARESMNQLKAKRETFSEEGEFEAFPEYKYSNEITEEEIDLLDFAGSLMGEEDEETDEESNDTKEKIKELAPSGDSENKDLESAPSIIFKVLHYKVTIIYGDNKEYTLDFYRGMGPG